MVTPYTPERCFDPKDQDTYNHSSPTYHIRQFGQPHTMIQYFAEGRWILLAPTEQNIWAM